MVLTKRTCNLPLICQICGDRARGINFDVMTCMSCKAFFRRHALQPKDSLRCPLDDNCKITQITRGGCSACRLKKCLSFGMNSTLIRHVSTNHHKLVKKKLPQLSTPLPLNLLRKDTSMLTNIEWNLLSNIIHAYDQGNVVEHSKCMLQQQSSLLPKLRTKSTTTLDIVGYFYTAFQSFIERVRFFQDLSTDARQALQQRTSETTGAYNSIFLVRETNALDYSAYVVGCSNIYGHENFVVIKKFISQLENNGTLFKIMILIIGFSENCTIVMPNDIENKRANISAISLLRIQNILVTMLWKYLIYQYGFCGAVKCFNSYIKFILNLLRWNEMGKQAQHQPTLDTSLENIDLSLIAIN